MANLSRGDVWHVDLEPVRGHEQGRRRPAVIVSVDRMNRGPSEMIVIVPITSRSRPVPAFVRIDPPEGGLRAISFAICDQVRAVSKDRLLRRHGRLQPATLAEIEDRLRIILDL